MTTAGRADAAVTTLKIKRGESEYRWNGEWQVPAQLQHLPEDKLFFIARRLKPRQLKSGQLVFRAGDPGEGLSHLYCFYSSTLACFCPLSRPPLPFKQPRARTHPHTQVVLCFLSTLDLWW